MIIAPQFMAYLLDAEDFRSYYQRFRINQNLSSGRHSAGGRKGDVTSSTQLWVPREIPPPFRS